MLYHIAAYLQQSISAFNVFHYISFRTIASLLTSLCITLLIGKWFIKKSNKYFTSQAREYTPERHQQKNNIPTMGGILIIGVVIFTCMLWCNLTKLHVWLFLVGIVLFGIIGFWDDWQKITKRKGITAKQKWFLQIFFAFIISFLLIGTSTVSTTISFPFFKNLNPDLGWFFIAWAMFVIVACSNAVNLTDGLDGLASGVLLPNLGLFAFLSYASNHFLIAHYLHIPFAANAEITIIGGALIGAVLGFLWFNAHPAQIFMGDVGSLSLGASLALMGLMSKQEILIVLSGGIFVLETLSVMLQVLSFKYRGKRIFRMAPLHHHFELQGMHETKITTRFVIISIILCMLSLITLKIR
jgi:phospho-N-acetylmuramoyl-pentapeptide-transferase